MRKTPFIIALLLSVIFTGCRKDVRNVNTPAIRVEEIATGAGQPGIIIPPDNTLLPTDDSFNFVFDWEHADQMPVAPWVSPVAAPWSDQAIRHFDESLRYDMKKSDGWELVYSTFSDSVNHAKRYLVLYNKYRGVLRFYFHNPLPVNNDIKAAKSMINELEPAIFNASQNLLMTSSACREYFL